jgi:hypothetical protein
MNEKNPSYIQQDFVEKNEFLYKTMESLTREMSKKFGVSLCHEKHLPIIDIYNRVKAVDPKADKNLENILHRPNEKPRTLNPDGGLIYMDTLKGKRFLALTSELRKQGKVKKGHSIGNAIERTNNSISAIEDFTLIRYYPKKVILPFTVFCYGFDFDSEYVRTILHRGNNFRSLNEFNLDRVSYYAMNKFNKTLIKRTLKNCLETSINWYLDKYGKKIFSPAA